MDGLAYAYHAPKSTGQEAYTQARVAQFAAQRRERILSQDFTLHPPSIDSFQRTLSYDSLALSRSPTLGTTAHRRNASQGSVETPRAEASSLTSLARSDDNHSSLPSTPFEFRMGRRYLRDLPYPLPVDLPEIQRQNLRTLLACSVFGRAVCSSSIEIEIPRKVLEVGCGSGYWSALCHDYFASLGVKDASFTGLDVAPLAPNLRTQGVNWNFVQHDFRRIPFPFDDGEFDLIMIKDLSLTLPTGAPFQKFLDENIRILREGGTLEIWDSDHIIRSIMPHPPALHSKQPGDQAMADRTGTFLMAPGTPFAPAQNKYLTAANKWIAEALDRRKLPATPCTRIAPILLQEPDHLQDLGVRRVAIPLGEMRWERGGIDDVSDSPMSHMSSRKNSTTDDNGSERDAMRQTALMTVLQMIENMEPLLREASGKNGEEWGHWWASMMTSLVDPAKANLNGECLEIGAWWATKVFHDSDDDLHF